MMWLKDGAVKTVSTTVEETAVGNRCCQSRSITSCAAVAAVAPSIRPPLFYWAFASSTHSVAMRETKARPCNNPQSPPTNKSAGVYPANLIEVLPSVKSRTKKRNRRSYRSSSSSFFFLSFFLSNEPASIGDAHNLIEKIGHFQRIPFKTQSGQSNSKLVPSTRPILSLDVSLALFLRHPEEVWNERDQLKTVQWRVRTPEKRIGPNWNRLDPLGQTTRRKMLVGWCDIPTVNSVVIHIKLIWNDRWLSDSRNASDQYKLVVKMYYRSVNNWITDHQTSYTIPFWLFLIHHYLVLK